MTSRELQLRREARRRVVQRLGLCRATAPLGAYPWYGVGLVGWYFGDEDRRQVIGACDTLSRAVADVREEAEKITNATKKGPYINQLNAIDRQAATYRSSAEGGGIKSRVEMDQVLIYLGTAAPKALAVMRPLILADQRDPTGAMAEKMLKGQIEGIQAQQAEIMSSWYMDPSGWLQKQIEEGGKAVSGTLFGIQWSVIKGLWPVLLLGGGIAALWFFGPALGLVAKRLAGRVPGELPPGTQHQPGE